VQLPRNAFGVPVPGRGLDRVKVLREPGDRRATAAVVHAGYSGRGGTVLPSICRSSSFLTEPVLLLPVGAIWP